MMSLVTAGKLELKYLESAKSGSLLQKWLHGLSSTVFSFETAFMLFVFAGIFKADPRFSWFPIDITLLFFFISFAAACKIWLERKLMIDKGGFKIVLLHMFFAAYAIASLWWTPGPGYSTTKAFEVATILPWTLAGTSLIIAQDPARMRRFLTVFFLFSIWIAIESHISIRNTAMYWDIRALNGSYLGLGRVVGAGALVLLGYILFCKNHLLVKVLGLGAFGYYMYVLLNLGGRGPFLATILGTMLPALFAFKLSSAGFKVRGYLLLIVAILVACIGVVGYLIITDEETQTLYRMTFLFGGNGDMGSSADTRAEYYEDSIMYWENKPILGYGIGAFPLFYGMSSAMRLYPHNLFAEILVEMGLVGLLLFLAVFVSSIRYMFPLSNLTRHFPKLIVVMLLLNTFFNAQVTGDLLDNRFFFCMLGLLPFLRIPINKGESSHEKGSV
ncbi:O-antigen ligase family protein [Paenibacillus thalictri]|uniref:O-antigen ligase-related domain-containing protein n=1 Tax=Paenibacillus thalictri TaxID=2527873 RepID=A0A4Q9DHC9_9BACL|nr:O-antigen ligase family protein [Paenibacillus thalictri]TBL70845.1 hypothetical protein EYB31_31865 [Paenibacillus thalictri]